MRPIRSKHSALALAVPLLSALMFGAGPASHAQTPDQASLTGQLLVASPSMGDPRFAQTVVLMVQHDQGGAMGLIINRPVGTRPLAGVLEALGEKDTGATGSIRIFAGGPVQRELGFVLHSAEYRRGETQAIDGRVAMTSTREIFRDIVAGTGPAKSLVAFGYAGWGPGQLEGELALQAWYTAPADTKLIFDEDRDRVWELAVERRTREL